MATKENIQHLLASYSRLVRFSEKRVELQVTKGEKCVLGYLYQYGSARPGEISKMMKVSSARVTMMLNALEHRGMVTRKVDELDRRRINAELTKEGHQYMKALYTDIDNQCAHVMDTLGEEDTELLLRLLDRIVDIYEEQGEAQKKGK